MKTTYMTPKLEVTDIRPMMFLLNTSNNTLNSDASGIYIDPEDVVAGDVDEAVSRWTDEGLWNY